MTMFTCCVTSPERQAKKKAYYLLGNLDIYDDDIQQWFEEAIAPCQLLENHPKHKQAIYKETTTHTEDNLNMGLQVYKETTHPEDNLNMGLQVSDDMSSTSDDKLLEEKPDDNHLFAPKSSSPITRRGRQTYRMWKAQIEMSESFIFKTRIDDMQKTLHFFPLENFQMPNIGNFCIEGLSFVPFMVRFLQVFFPGMSVLQESLFDVNERMTDVTSRFHSVTDKKQFLVGDLYGNLHQATSVPRKHYILGMTWTDLYPKEELNFVLGEASSWHRCAVLSFGRFEPKTYEAEEEVELQMNGDLLWQLLRVASHETCHLFGFQHCAFFSCAMNESKSVKEALDQPLFLCPVCLRKLQKFLGFDIRKRYNDLLDLCVAIQNAYPSQQLEGAVHWLRKCVSSLS